MSIERRAYNLWVVLSRSDEIKGAWDAHVLDFDIVTYGHSLLHAMEMAREATSMFVADSMAAGLEPDRLKAPLDAWEGLERIFKSGRFVQGSIESIFEHDAVFDAVAIQERLEVACVRQDPAAPSPKESFELAPSAWAVQAVA